MLSLSNFPTTRVGFLLSYILGKNKIMLLHGGVGLGILSFFVTRSIYVLVGPQGRIRRWTIIARETRDESIDSGFLGQQHCDLMLFPGCQKNGSHSVVELVSRP
jgi:hypothetical protein